MYHFGEPDVKLDSQQLEGGVVVAVVVVGLRSRRSSRRPCTRKYGGRSDYLTELWTRLFVLATFRLIALFFFFFFFFFSVEMMFRHQQTFLFGLVFNYFCDRSVVFISVYSSVYMHFGFDVHLCNLGSISA